MTRRAGVQTEVLVSLGVVMVLATLVLATVLVVHQERVLRDLLGRVAADKGAARRFGIELRLEKKRIQRSVKQLGVR